MPKPTSNISPTSLPTSKLTTSESKAVESQFNPNSLPTQDRGEQKFGSNLDPVNSSTKNNILEPNSNIAKIKAVGQRTFNIASTILPENNLTIPQATGESLSQDYADNDLQQAIDNLTQSFEGQVIQLGNIAEESLEESELEQLDAGFSDLYVNEEDDDEEW